MSSQLLNECPKCGGPADNGHDREYPPNPYFCTKCMSNQTLSPLREALADAIGAATGWEESAEQLADKLMLIIRQHEADRTQGVAKDIDVSHKTETLIGKLRAYYSQCEEHFNEDKSSYREGKLDAADRMLFIVHEHTSSEIRLTKEEWTDAVLKDFKTEGNRTKAEEWEAAYAMLFKQFTELQAKREPQPAGEVAIDSLVDDFIASTGGECNPVRYRQAMIDFWGKHIKREAQSGIRLSTGAQEIYNAWMQQSPSEQESVCALAHKCFAAGFNDGHEKAITREPQPAGEITGKRKIMHAIITAMEGIKRLKLRETLHADYIYDCLLPYFAPVRESVGVSRPESTE